MTWFQTLRLFLATALWPKSTGRIRSVANRWEQTIPTGRVELTLRLKDMTKPDGYSREELISMLGLVRAEEQRQGWTIPDIPPFGAVMDTIVQEPSYVVRKWAKQNPGQFLAALDKFRIIEQEESFDLV